MKKDLQYKRTDRAIINAFIKLSQQKPFEKIRALEIMEEAMVNRSTFYHHFKDKYDIAERLMSYYVNEFRLVVEPLYHNPLTLQESTKVIQAFFTEHKDILSSLVKIKTKQVNIVNEFQTFYQNFYLSSTNTLDAVIEASLFANAYVSFMIYYIEHGYDSTFFIERFVSVVENTFFKLMTIDDNNDELKDIISQRLHERQEARNSSNPSYPSGSPLPY